MLFNRNIAKISCACIPFMKTVIKKHDKTVMWSKIGAFVLGKRNGSLKDCFRNFLILHKTHKSVKVEKNLPS